MFDELGYQIQYTLIQGIAGLFWLINQSLLGLAVLTYVVQKAIIDVSQTDPQHAGFAIQMVDDMLRSASLPQLLIVTLTLAVLLLGFTYILRPILHLDLVDPKRVLLWLFAAGLLFSVGGSFFLGLEQLRGGLRDLAQGIINPQREAQRITNPGTSSIQTDLPNAMGGRWHHFGDIIPPAPQPPPPA